MHSKPAEKSQYNKPTNWKTIAIGVAIVIIFLNIISLISTTPEIPNNSDKYNPPASQTPTFTRPAAAPAPAPGAPAAPLPTNHNRMAPALPNPDFKYNGYISNGMKKMAIINNDVYKEGGLLRDIYRLKKIEHNYLVIRNERDRSQFEIARQ